MATNVSAAPRRAFRGPWVPILAMLILVVVIGGVAFAVGRNSAPNPTRVRGPVQSSLGSQLTGMVPWMQNHMGDLAWMQNHMGDVTWMRSHWNQWQWMQGHTGNIRWMQTHPAQWRWMQTHPAQWGWMQATCRTSDTCTTTMVSGPAGVRARAMVPIQGRRERTGPPTNGTAGSAANSPVETPTDDPQGGGLSLLEGGPVVGLRG